MFLNVSPDSPPCIDKWHRHRLDNTINNVNKSGCLGCLFIAVMLFITREYYVFFISVFKVLVYINILPLNDVCYAYIIIDHMCAELSVLW